MNDTVFDVVVIGSGLSGLTTAAILSKFAKKKVLVLEKHFKPGGLTHEFSRKNYSWVTGLHYVGGMGDNDFLKYLFDYITNGKLTWYKMKNPHEKYCYPDLKINITDNPGDFKKKLISTFPEEKKAIIKYFSDINKMAIWVTLDILSRFVFKNIIKLINAPMRYKALMKTQDYLNKYFKDNRLKAILTSKWGNYGLPPGESTFGIHCLIEKHYSNGAYFPEKGSSSIFKCIKKIIENRGGKIITNKKAQEIIIKKNRAIGVKTEDVNSRLKKDYFADTIISSIGVYNTYKKLLKNNGLSNTVSQLERFYQGYSTVILFIGLNASPEVLGINGGNIWLREKYEHNNVFKQSVDLLNGKPQWCFLSFSSLNKRIEKKHTAEILTFLSYNHFKKWENQKWQKRSADYYALKETISKGLLNFADKYIPGFLKLVDYYELATPLTIEHFTGKKYGAPYGIPFVPARFNLRCLTTKTPLNRLYLSGIDISAGGIAGALLSGLVAASAACGPMAFFAIMKSVFKKRRKGKDRTEKILPLLKRKRKQLLR